MTGLQATEDGKTSFQTDFFSSLLNHYVKLKVVASIAVFFSYIRILDATAR
jgi:hypothetical protein